MAGLLDIFGTGGTQTLGLLGGDIQAARDEAQANALYALAGSLLSGGHPGLSIVKGLQQGQQAYKDAMLGRMQEQLQGVQVEDLLRKRKLEQEALARQQMIDRAIARAYIPGQPEVAAQPAQFYGAATQMPVRDDEGNLMPNAVEAIAGRAAVAPRIDIQAIAPALMASPEGRKTLGDLMTAQKAMLGETVKVGEGEKAYRINPLTGQPEFIFSGGEKPEKLTGIEGNIAHLRFGTNDVNKLMAIPGAAAYIKREAENQRKESKPVINLNDPTAVYKQQLETVTKWENFLSSTKTDELANRANNFYQAYNLAQTGNKSADGAMIYNVAKLYDPTGVVQQADIKNVVGNRSIPEAVRFAAQKVTSGGTLLDSERKNLKSIIDELVTSRQKNIIPSLNAYRAINSKLGGDPSLLINPLEMIEKPKSLNEILGGGR